MAGAKAVIFALRALGKAAEAPVLAQGGKRVLTPGENLVDVGLVAYVPDKLVPGHGKHLKRGMVSSTNFQVGGQMAAVFGGHLDQQVTDFLAQLG